MPTKKTTKQSAKPTKPAVKTAKKSTKTIKPTAKVSNQPTKTVKKPTKTVKKTTKQSAKPSVKTPSKAEQLVAGVRVMHDEALELAESVIFMASKLEESRKAMINEPLVVPYDNGGGQMGMRENPHYTAYEKLMNTYSRSLAQLTQIIEKGSTNQKSIGVMAELTTIAGRKIG